MLRFIFRSFAIVLFAIAFMYAVIDVTIFIGSDRFTPTPLVESWTSINEQSLFDFRVWLESRVHSFLNDPLLAFVLAAPTWLVAGVLSLFFFALSYRRKRTRFGRI